MVMVANEPGSDARYWAGQLGAEIRRLMNQQEINGYELAYMTGIRRTKMHRILNGERTTMLTPPELKAIADALGTTQEHLLRAAGFDIGTAA